MLMKASPVVVLSAPRSGSTLLRLLLDTHPAISAPGELGLGALARHLACVFDSLDADGAPLASATKAEADLRKRRHFRLWPAWQRWPLPFSRADSIPRVRELLVEMIGRHLERTGKTVFCERTPENSEELDVLAAVFPDARYVMLHRHALDVTYSLVERNQFGIPPDYALFSVADPTNFVDGALRYWVDTTRTLLVLEESLGARCRRVRYEDLVQAPHHPLAELFSFLEVPADPSVPERVFTASHRDGVGDFKAPLSRALDPGRIGKGTRIPLDRVSAALIAETNQLLCRLGYPEVGSSWNTRSTWQVDGAMVSVRAPAVSVEADDLEPMLARALADLRARGATLGGSILLELRDDRGPTRLRVDGTRSVVERVDATATADTCVSIPRELLLRAMRKEVDLLEANNLSQVSVSGEVELAMTLLHAALVPT